MKTEAYFDNIKQIIVNELLSAKKSILVAVAWFTDNDLFDILCEKAKGGLNIELIIAEDEININCNLQYDKLNRLGGQFQFHKSINNSLMHNKFCVIDLKKTITGSYNWSYKARNNRENIVITNNSALALQFAKQFYKLKLGNYTAENNQLTERESVNLTTYLKRLLIFIQGKKYKEINSELFILKNLDYTNEEVRFIMILLGKKQWEEAEYSIIDFLKIRQQIVIYEDLELKTLKYHKEALENRFDKLLIEKNEIERKILQFNIEYSQKLGKVLEELLKLQAKYNIKYEGAFNETGDSINDFLKIKRTDLSNEEQKEIKRLYKKAAVICHPDKVDESLKKEAEATFKTLHKAFINNDIGEVFRIYENLKVNSFLLTGKNYNERDRLVKQINRIIYKINQIKTEIDSLKITPAFQVLEKIYDWNMFYRLEEQKIINEINMLKNEFSKKNIFQKRAKKSF